MPEQMECSLSIFPLNLCRNLLWIRSLSFQPQPPKIACKRSPKKPRVLSITPVKKEQQECEELYPPIFITISRESNANVRFPSPPALESVISRQQKKPLALQMGLSLVPILWRR